jgi:hypothetical protein
MAARHVVTAFPVIVLGLLITGCHTTSAAASAPAAPSQVASAPAPAPTASAATTPAAATTAAPAAPSPATSAPVASAPASAPVATVSAAGTVESCQQVAASHTYIYVAKATWNTDGSLNLTGQIATMVCGGPDDFHYAEATATVSAETSATAKLTVIGTSQNQEGEPITYQQFPGYIVNDQWTRVFEYTGPLTAITSLTEMYHP